MRKDISKETGYLGDVDTSSIESMEAQSSDSDDISSTSRKGKLDLYRSLSFLYAFGSKFFPIKLFESFMVTVFVHCAELGKSRFTRESSSVHVHCHSWQIN